MDWQDLKGSRVSVNLTLKMQDVDSKSHSSSVLLRLN
jgi:hypothetical protein